MKKQTFEICEHPSIYNGHTSGIFRVEGYPLSFDSRPGVDFCVVKRGKTWSVHEVKSGLHVMSKGKTRKEVIDSTQKRIESISPERLKEAVESGAKDKQNFVNNQ